MTQNLCDAFNGGGEDWEVADALRRVETRIWSAAVDTLDGSADEAAYFDAYDLVVGLRESFDSRDDADDYGACFECGRSARKGEIRCPKCVPADSDSLGDSGMHLGSYAS